MPGVLAGPSKPKTSFRKARVVGPLYTGGPLVVDRDGQRVVSTLGDDVVLTDVVTGQRICQFQTDGEAPSSLALSAATSTSLQLLLVFTASLALHVFELPSTNSPLDRPVQPIRQISRAHDAPVHICVVDSTSSFLASGSADGVVKVWDIRRGYVTHNFRGHGGVVSALTFSMTPAGSLPSGELQLRLFTASGDNLVRVFNLTSAASRTAGAKAELALDGHVSVPRALCVTPDQRWLISSGRDSVILVWDLLALLKTSTTASKKGKGKAAEPKPHRTILVQERIEAAGLLAEEDLPEHPGQVRVYAGGEKGTVRVWDALSGKELVTLGSATKAAKKLEEQQEILSICHIESTASIATVHADQNIIFYSLSTGRISRQLIGFNDEVVDALFLSPSDAARDSHLAVATNSSLIRVYSTSPEHLDATLLYGHADVVLCLDRGQSGQLLASGSKDRSARIWTRQVVGGRDEWRCMAYAEGHAESVGAIAMSRDSGAPKFMFTGSQDRTVKMWDLAPLDLEAEEPIKLQSLTTQKAHEKDINSLDISPNDKLLATGSQDKTAKIFAIEYRGTRGGEIKALGVCKGHKRGVWNVRFGRTERVLATGSGDKTIKLWNLEDFTCIKTFEGHTNSVLRVDFVSDSMQLMSSASDGLVKLWNVGSQECIATLDNHEDKVWALAVSSDERTVVSAAADSVITFWEDSTELEREEKAQKAAEEVQTEQDFINYLALNDYKKAILLGLAMDQPGRLYKLFKTIRAEEAESNQPVTTASLTGHTAVDEVLRTLSAPDLARLLRHVRTWNTTARTSAVAQGILHAVLKLRSVSDIVAAFAPEVAALEGNEKKDGEAGLTELIEGLIPYSERHLTRVERLVQESYTIDFLLAEMDGLEISADDVDMDGEK